MPLQYTKHCLLRLLTINSINLVNPVHVLTNNLHWPLAASVLCMWHRSSLNLSPREFIPTLSLNEQQCLGCHIYSTQLPAVAAAASTLNLIISFSFITPTSLVILSCPTYFVSHFLDIMHLDIPKLGLV